MKSFQKDPNIDFSIILISSFLLLSPFGRLSNIPMAVMCLLGTRLLILREIDFQRREYKYFSFVFLCFFIPIICSFPDAVNKGNVASVAGFYTTYFFSGIYVVRSLVGNYSKQHLLLKICAYALIIWVIDALVQVAFGYDFFGFHRHPVQLNGLFGEKNPKLGIYLAALSPLLFVYCCRYFHWFVWLFFIVATSAVIFLSGSRSGWVMLLVVLCFFALWQTLGEKRISIKWLSGGVVIVCFVMILLYLFSPGVQARVEQSMLVFSGNAEAVNLGTGKRLPIWKTALRMIKDHPINGVGARGFRYAYNDYADEDDIFVDKKSSLGAYQAHQLILDILANTGLIGLVGLAGAFAVVLLNWIKGTFKVKIQMVPYALALLAVFFPINSHFATYSSQWSSMLFWLIALFFAHLNVNCGVKESF